MIDPHTTSASEAQTGGMDRKIARPRRWWRRLGWPIAGVGLVVVLGVLVALAPRPGSLSVKRADVQISTVERAPFQDYLPLRAAVAPAKSVYVGAVQGGQVERVVAVDGSEVAAGDVLATLSNPQLMMDVTSHEAEIAGSLSNTSGQQLTLQANRHARERDIADAEFSLLTAQADLAKYQRLHDLGDFSDAGLKTYADKVTYYRDRVRNLKTGAAQEDAIAQSQAAGVAESAARLKANLAQVQSSLDALTLRAPVAGRLTNFPLQVGQTLKVGDPVGQIDSEGDYKLTADVDEFYLARVAVGLPASAQVEDASYPLVVSRVLPQVTEGRFRIELVFKGRQPPGLKRGESLDVRLTFGDPKPALVADNGPWMEAGGGAYAFVLNAAGDRADRRPIQTARRNPEQVEITGGLKPGERVVTSSYAGYEKYQHLVLTGGEGQ
jgi:HlyD family secretion protein